MNKIKNKKYLLVCAVFAILILNLIFINLAKNNRVKANTENVETTIAVNTVTTNAINQNNGNTKSVNSSNTVILDEETRKSSLGEFYVPLPSTKKEKKDIEVRGVYLNPEVVALPFNEDNIEAYKKFIEDKKNGNNVDESSVSYVNDLEKTLAMAQTTQLNSIVIDIKTDLGTIAWDSDIEVVNRLNASKKVASDNFKSILEYMNNNNIYAIARIVVFKDVNLSNIEPEHAIKLKDGSLFKDYAKQSWLNPFDSYVWKYTTAISQEAALRGFDEIHFDYLRYPENAADYNDKIELEGREGRTKDESISMFLSYAKENLAPYGVKISGAVFGTVNQSWEDKPEDIGQTWRKMADKLDRISPMIYPSHYQNNYLGLAVPDANPYEFIKGISLSGLKKNMLIENPAIYTPWIQAFTAEWVEGHIEYKPEVIKEQIKALNHLGYNSYLLWNASGKYKPETLIYEIEESKIPEGTDILGTSPNEVVANYFNALMNGEYIKIYSSTPIANRPYDYMEFRNKFTANNLNIDTYSYEEAGDLGKQQVTITYTKNGEKHENEVIDVEVIEENGYFKIKVPETFIKFN